MLLQNLSHLFYLVQFIKCWPFFLELNYKRPYGVQQKKNKVVLCSHSPQNVKLGILCCSRVVMAKKFTKKHDARAELLFCQSKLITFLPFSLMSPSLLAKLLIISHKWLRRCFLMEKKLTFPSHPRAKQ